MRVRRGGFTLLELAIAMTILSLLAMNISMVTRTGSNAARSGAFYATLNDEADMALDRISLAVMSSDASDIYPVAVAPGFTDSITYSVRLGIENGEIVESPPESITYDQTPQTGRIVWFQNPGLPGLERSVVWSNWVPHFQDAELENAVDDNGNDLTDESGLAFDMVGDRVNIHLTVERQSPDGKLVPATRRINVTCRN